MIIIFFPPADKWKQQKYQRQGRNERALERAAVNNQRITEFWPVIDKMEKMIKENESLHSTVRLLLNRLAETRETPLPPVSAFLQALIETAVKNADKKKGGGRFEKVKLMATHFFLLCGPRAYIDLHGNLEPALPSLSTVKNTVHQYKQVLVEGQFRWDELSEFLDQRGYPREVRTTTVYLRAGSEDKP